jgi:SAM-dependent methyltransferase
VRREIVTEAFRDNSSGLSHNRETPANDEKARDYYDKRYRGESGYARPYPNFDRARRWAKICEFLSQVPNLKKHGVGQRLRILDVGCGNGWMTYLANVYGQCDGVDTSEGGIEQARKHFPALTFYVGTARDVLQSPNFKPYDVVIASEVIEHVTDKEEFVTELKECLVPRGHVILTTPRGEKQRKYWRSRGRDSGQPIEAWIREKELRALFERHQLEPIKHDRAYIPLRELGILYKLSASVYLKTKLSQPLRRLRLTGLVKALEYPLGIYQVWCFRAKRPAKKGTLRISEA